MMNTHRTITTTSALCKTPQKRTSSLERRSIPPAKIAHDGSPSSSSYLGLDQDATDFPISLYKGEKREYATDISLNTPAGALTFTRTYRQSKQATYTFMGL